MDESKQNVRQALNRAIEAHPTHQAAGLAADLGIAKQRISQMLSQGEVPAQHVGKIVKLSGGAVTCRELNPPVFSQCCRCGEPEAQEQTNDE